MEHQVIEVERRDTRKKGAARRLRRQGKIPGVLYGHKETPFAFSVNPSELRKKIRAAGMGRNTLFDVKGVGRQVLALLKDAQVDPVRRDLVHVDLVEVRAGDRVTIDVPLEFIGKPVGVIAGGELTIMSRIVTLRASPLSIPKSIEVNVEPLELGATLHASDLSYPEGTECTSPRAAIVGVRIPRAEEVAEAPADAAAVPAEGEAAAVAAAAPAESEAEAE
jgi:large subunit ribosomal protein L25